MCHIQPCGSKSVYELSIRKAQLINSNLNRIYSHIKRTSVQLNLSLQDIWHVELYHIILAYLSYTYVMPFRRFIEGKFMIINRTCIPKVAALYQFNCRSCSRLGQVIQELKLECEETVMIWAIFSSYLKYLLS